MSGKPRVLVIAEAANPEWVSVPLVGWSVARALGDVADTHIVTQIRNREAFLRAGLTEGEAFTVIDSEAIARPLNKLSNMLRMGDGKGWTMVTAIRAVSYPYFEHLVWKRFGPAIEAGEYGIVHRVTPLTPTTVSPISARCVRAGVPFIVGPLNGGVPWPKGFDAERRNEREWLSYVRGVYKLLPGRRRMYDSTAAIIAGSRHTESEIPDRYRDKTFWLPENAIDPARFNRVAEAYSGGALRGVFIGRLVPYKGPDMLLEAAASLLKAGRFKLDIIGDGPMRETLEKQARAIDAGAGAITFHGQLDHAAVQDVAVRSQLLTFPSIREFGGGVVLEAMALGVVPVIVDYAGPGELVSRDEGYKIPLGDRGRIVTELERVLTEICDDSSDLETKSRAARARVAAAFTWEAKARQLAEIYAWVLGQQTTKPEPVKSA